MLGEGDSYSGKVDLFFLYVTASPIWLLLGMLSHSIGGEEANSWEILHLYHEEPVDSLVWWSYRSGQETPG